MIVQQNSIRTFIYDNEGSKIKEGDYVVVVNHGKLFRGKVSNITKTCFLLLLSKIKLKKYVIDEPKNKLINDTTESTLRVNYYAGSKYNRTILKL